MTPLYHHHPYAAETPVGSTAAMGPRPADAADGDDNRNNDVVLVVSRLPSHPSMNSLSGSSAASGGEHSSSSSNASVEDGGGTVSSAGGSSSTTSSKRTTSADAAAVRQKVQDAWRARREERDQQRGIAPRAAGGASAAGGRPPPSGAAAVVASHPKQQPEPRHPNLPASHGTHQLQLAKRGTPLGLPLLCAMVQKGWKDAFDKPKPKAKKPDRPKVFPSMLSILEANALATQVRNLQEDEEDDDTDDDDDDDDVSVLGDSTRGADSPRDEAPAAGHAASPADPAVASVLSILPTGYDWNKAILQMAQSRSRAFLLLDLAAIVRRTVLWKRTYPGVTWVHSVSANANQKLLQVLLMAGVRLATTTRTDLAHALDAQAKLKRHPAPTTSQQQQLRHRTIVDSTARAAPPDSYIRELLNAKVFAITVDGADEVHRVVRTVQRMQARHGGNSHGIKLELTLRLHPTSVSSWRSTARDTLAALEEYPVHELTGMSLDVGGAAPVDDVVPRRQAEAERVKDLILRSIPSVKIHLTGFEGGGDEFPQEWVEWWARQRSDPRVREVSVECSFPLIASAGALCTRIIGVRAIPSERKQQLYIDDGCYGTLYQARGDLTPIPLGNYGADPAGEQAPYTSTLWGPTCDGLDRVCRDIALPKLERDEWLVFPNLGCPGGLGTAFNGFEPPDTAYCVLGYFK